VTSEHFLDRDAVLRDYPLRLWARQQEYSEDLLREFNLLVMGEQSGAMRSAAPGQLVELAELFRGRFGAAIDALNAERQAALDRGLDRFDSRVPLAVGTPQLLEQARAVLRAADEFCARGDLLTLPRPPELRALSDWSLDELIAQYDGAEPTPWPGPF
jgi:hypothetical protein